MLPISLVLVNNLYIIANGDIGLYFEYYNNRKSIHN